MIRRHFSLIAVLLVGAPILHADDAKPAEAPPPYELKNRSAFADPTQVPRVPFWPIGWVKRQAASPSQPQLAEPVKTTLDEKSFKVTSILLNTGTSALAVINGRAYGEGEYLHMPRTAGAAPIHIQVRRIADGLVTLQHADQTLVIPITRPELLDKKPEELLLDPNR